LVLLFFIPSSPLKLTGPSPAIECLTLDDL
jgi:hypothetical protein